MTTFQVIVDAIFRTLSGVIPLSYAWIVQFEEQLLHFSSKAELEHLVSYSLTIGFLFYFRYDWLGLIAAFMRTVSKPTTVKNEHRTLDQEVLLFLTLVTIPVFLIQNWIKPMFMDSEHFHSFITNGICFLLAAGGLRFAYRWNKRMNGLNHLRLFDALPVALVCLLSVHPSFPLALTLWIGLSIRNYHYEAIFKYSILVLGIQSIGHSFGLITQGTSLKAVIEGVGHLNAIAAIVICFSAMWMAFENLQKDMSENTFRSFQWLNVLAAISCFALFFLKG